MQEIDFLWEHFKLHADQRIKAFNFFVVLSIFADGGVITALAKNSAPYLLFVLGIFIMSLSIIFWILDVRSHALVKLSYKGIKRYELTLPVYSRLFTKDARRNKGVFRYTLGFAGLFTIQIVFGLFVVGVGLFRVLC